MRFNSAQKCLFFSTEYKRYLKNKLRSKQLYYRKLNLLNSRWCQDRHSPVWDLLMMACLFEEIYFERKGIPR